MICINRKILREMILHEMQDMYDDTSMHIPWDDEGPVAAQVDDSVSDDILSKYFDDEYSNKRRSIEKFLSKVRKHMYDPYTGTLNIDRFEKALERASPKWLAGQDFTPGQIKAITGWQAREMNDFIEMMRDTADSNE